MENMLQEVMRGTLRHYLLQEISAVETPIISPDLPRRIRADMERIREKPIDHLRTIEDFSLCPAQEVTQSQLCGLITEFYVVRGFQIRKLDDYCIAMRREGEEGSVLVAAAVISDNSVRVTVTELPY